MPLIGVRDLRTNTSEVLRRVREDRVEYVVTHQGRPVALIVPVDQEAIEKQVVETAKQTARGGWEAYLHLAESLRHQWPKEQDSQSILDDVRQS